MPYMGLAQDAFLAPVAKTASYYIKPSENGTLFTNKGASGAVTFFLPPIAEVSAGWSVRFYVAASFSTVISAPSGKLITFNNAAATSVAFSQASEMIGNGAEIVFDGALYMATLNLTAEAVTITVA